MLLKNIVSPCAASIRKYEAGNTMIQHNTIQYNTIQYSFISAQHIFSVHLVELEDSSVHILPKVLG